MTVLFNVSHIYLLLIDVVMKIPLDTFIRGTNVSKDNKRPEFAFTLLDANNVGF